VRLFRWLSPEAWVRAVLLVLCTAQLLALAFMLYTNQLLVSRNTELKRLLVKDTELLGRCPVPDAPARWALRLSRNS
jgi:hypothetical protein